MEEQRDTNLNNRLNNTNGDSLTHVTNSKSSKRWVVSESFDTHWLGRHHLNDSGVTRLDELGSVLNGFSSTTVNLLQKLGELAGNVSCVAVENWCVSSSNLTGVVEDNDLSIERLGTLGRVVLGVTRNVTTTDLLDGDVLNVEADVVTGKSLCELLVVHLNRLDFGCDAYKIVLVHRGLKE